MKKCGYIKKRKYEDVCQKIENIRLVCSNILSVLFTKRIVIGICCFAVLFGMITFLSVHKSLQDVTLSEESFLQIGTAPMVAAKGKTGVISVPSGITKANPFVPYGNAHTKKVVSDVPTCDLVEPPEMINENSDAARVMDTIVSGILYDKYSPSAILNIEGNDYLVKKGDVINNYKVLNIVKDSVTVKLGTNIYKAGIGEILTEGSLTYNDVSNLNNKFGGVKK